MKILKISLFVIILMSFISTVSAVTFSGYTYDVTGGALNATNVTIELWQESPWGVNTTYSSLSNATGNWSITINVSVLTGKMVKFVPRHYNGTDADYVGGILPPFPYAEISQMLNLSAVNFYLKEGATINITAVNESNEAVNFTYMVKDVKLGFPIEADWQTSVLQKTVYLPADRNYSIEIFPTESMPIYYDLNNLSDYSAPKRVDIIFNTTTMPVRVTGRFNLSNGTGSNFDEMKIINYLLEPGDMVFAGMAMPYNMSAWDNKTDIYDTTDGTYNISLEGTAMSSKVLMFAIARVGDEYYGGFRNISPTIAGGDINDFNFTLYKLLGSPTNISVEKATGGTINITASKTTFVFINSSGNALTTATAHLEVELSYSNVDSSFPDFTWMVDVEQGGQGRFTLPLLNYSVKKLNMFTQNFAPLKLKYTAAQLDVSQVNVTLTQFNPGCIPGEEDFGGIQMRMMKSSAECDVPQPPSSCYFEGMGNQTEADFKPLNAVISGGKISLRITKDNITVHYKNVDMIASGPPDAVFDNSANESASGSLLEAAWRFGSKGPEIYDSILVGIPYDEADVDESAPISVLITNLYDENWNVIWNSTAYPNGENYSDVADGDFSDFNSTWFNSTLGGMSCSLTSSTADCFVNTTTNMIWLQIPHFSGIGPATKSVTKGNVTVNTTSESYECIGNCSVYINVTHSNYTLSQSLQNITINNTDTTGNVIWFKIFKYNSSDFMLNGTNSTNHTNYNFTLYNGSSSTVHQYRVDINKSTNPFTQWNFTYNISGMSEPLVLTINLTCESWSCTSWSACSGGTQTRTCTDANACGTTYNKPAESQSCTTPTTGGGGGGGAVVVTESQSLNSISSGATGVFDFEKSDDLNVYQVEVTVTEDESYPKVTVRESSAPVGALLAISVELGRVYKYISISSNVPDDEISKVIIKFKIPKSWFTDKDLDPATTKLKRYKAGDWISLTTSQVDVDADYYYFEAESTGFTTYVITAEKAKVVEKPPEEVEEEVLTVEEEKPPVEKPPVEEPPVKPSAQIVAIVFVLVVLVVVAYYVYTKKEKKK